MARKPRQSPLENHPQYPQALGMIAIELANLEVSLSDMMGALLRIDRFASKVLYFTPKSSTARMETLANLSADLLRKDPLAREAEAMVKRSLTIVSKRNSMLHDVWGVDQHDRNQVMTISFPSGKKKPVELTKLTDMVRDLRVLADEVVHLTNMLAIRPHSHYQVNITYQSSRYRATGWLLISAL